MTIPASHIVKVEPRVITGGSNDLEMNGLVLSRNQIFPAGPMVLEFGSASAVGSYFGLDSDEYAAAVTYFAGYVNKSSAPRSFFVARRIEEAAPGWLRSAPYQRALVTLQAVTDGALVIEIDGVAHSLDNLNFSTAGSFSDVAVIIQQALRVDAGGVTVNYSSLNHAFTITSGTDGAASSVGFGESPAVGTDLSEFLSLTEAKGAIISPGSDPLDVAEQMAAIRKVTENWACFTTLWEADVDEIMTWATWANDHYGWLYVPFTTDPNTPLQTSTADPASTLKEAGLEHTAIVYGSLEYALFIMGAVASISWLRTNGTITLAFKRSEGLAAYVTDEGEAAALEAKNCNYFGNFSTRNAEFVFLYSGCLSAGDYNFIDPYINSIWLNNRLQVALLDGLSRAGRVPYNERGYTMIRAWMQDPVNQGLANGTIETGIVLSEAQKTELYNEAGRDISTDLAINGYYLQVLDPGAAVRARRESPVVNFFYTYGGAVHRIEVASTAVL
jgi:Protein of unknown function (DUF3383).